MVTRRPKCRPALGARQPRRLTFTNALAEGPWGNGQDGDEAICHATYLAS